MINFIRRKLGLKRVITFSNAEAKSLKLIGKILVDIKKGDTLTVTFKNVTIVFNEIR